MNRALAAHPTSIIPLRSGAGSLVAGVDAANPLLAAARERIAARLASLEAERGEGAAAPAGAPETPVEALAEQQPSEAPARPYKRYERAAWAPTPEQQRRLSSTVLHGSSRRLCGAWCKSAGRLCVAPVVDGRWRCRVHGGLSSGAKTPEGRARIAGQGRRVLREAHQARAILQRLHAEGRLPADVQWPPADTEEAA
jgi:hypothetical protein